jgi:hypothetical protein
VRCLFGAWSVPDPRSSCSSGIAPCPDGRLGSPVGVAEVDKKRVCTMCTLYASDWGVLGADRAGFGISPREAGVYKGWSPVRVPPRARITPRQRGFCFNVWTLTLVGSL